MRAPALDSGWTKNTWKREILMSPLLLWIQLLWFCIDDCNETKYNYHKLLWYDKNLGDGGFGVLLNCPLCHTPLTVTRYRIRLIDLYYSILTCSTLKFVFALHTKSLQHIFIINFSFKMNGNGNSSGGGGGSYGSTAGYSKARWKTELN